MYVAQTDGCVRSLAALLDKVHFAQGCYSRLPHQSRYCLRQEVPGTAEPLSRTGVACWQRLCVGHWCAPLTRNEQTDCAVYEWKPIWSTLTNEAVRWPQSGRGYGQSPPLDVCTCEQFNASTFWRRCCPCNGVEYGSYQ